MKGLILEGISNAGKTSVLKRLRPRIAGGDHDLVLCSQAFTQRMCEHLTGNDRIEAAQAAVEQTLQFVEFHHARFRMSRLSARADALRFCPIFIAESFHLNQMLEMGFRDDAWRDSVDDRLKALGVRTILLSIPDEQILQRTVAQSKQHRGQNWASYLQRLGAGEAEQADYFRRAQRDLVQMLSRSRSRYEIIDTGSQDWDAITDAAMRELVRCDPASLGHSVPGAATAANGA